MTASSHFKVRQVTESDSDRLMAFLLEHYYREEPLNVGTGPPAEPPVDDQQFLLSLISFGTCILAEDPDGRILGAVMAGPKDADTPELMRQEKAKHAGSKWGRFLDLLSAVESGSDVCRRFNVPSCLHVHAMGVSREHRGQVVTVRLIQAVIQRARDLGHRLVSVDCTSAYSARVMQRLNYELVHTLRYADHLDAEGRQVVTPPPPHESVQTFVSHL